MIFFNYAILSKCSLFERIPLQDLKKAVACLQGFVKSFKKDESIYKPGSKKNLPGVVMSGSLQIYQIFPDGNEVLLRTVLPAELFGVSLFYQSDENIYVTSAENTSVLFLNLPSKNEQSSCNCKYRMIILENLIFTLASTNHILNSKIQILSRPSLREKIELFLKNQEEIHNSAKFSIEMTREKMANFLNADRSAVSRELGKMKKDGLINFTRNDFEIKF